MASQNHNKNLTYADAGVSIEAGDRFASRLGGVLKRTHGPRVISNPGGFAGLFRLDYNEALFKRNYRDPVLVACTDGVGTKIRVAIELGVYETIGIDLVAMSVNELVVQSAETLFILDYIACNRVDESVLLPVAEGIAEACRRTGCALLGGETAEMPDLYAEGDLDLAGFAVGVVELKRATDPTRVSPGDVVLGLESDGIHANGYSLVRRIVAEAGLDPDRVAAPLERPLGEELLRPTRLYAAPIVEVLRAYRVKKVVTAMAHITGGGLAANLERSLPADVDARIDPKSWRVPPIFTLLRRAGGVSPAEMRRVFNMGIGFCLVVRPAFADSIARRLEKQGERVRRIGEIVPGSGRVRLTRTSTRTRRA